MIKRETYVYDPHCTDILTHILSGKDSTKCHIDDPFTQIERVMQGSSSTLVGSRQGALEASVT